MNNYTRSKGSRSEHRQIRFKNVAGIPRHVMASADYRHLSGNAVKLLVALAYQFRGKNNGDLTATYSVMHERFGFRSKATLTRALKELLAKNIITKTREGMFLNPGGRCTLYALTWSPIDECDGKLDVPPTLLATRREWHPKNRTPGSISVQGSPQF